MTIKELREKYAALLEKAKAILAKADEEDRDLSEDEKTEFDATKAEAETVGNRLERHKELEEAEARDIPIITPENAPRPMPKSDDEDDVANPDSRTWRKVKSTEKPEARYFGLRAYTDPEDAVLAGHFFRAACFGDKGSQKWCEKRGIELRTAQAEGTGYLGGYLVPVEVSNGIIRLVEERGVFRREAYGWPMKSDTAEVPRRTSGLNPYPIGENTEITESNMAWDQVKLVANKWGILTKISSELAEDATANIGDLITQEIAYSMADKEDECGFNGDGTSACHGIHGATVKIDDGTHTSSVITFTTGDTTWGDQLLGDYEGMVGTLPSYAESNAKWYFSKPAFTAGPQRLMDTAGGNTQDTLAGPRAKQFLGYPVVFSPVLNTTLTAQTDTIGALFGDLRQGATFGVRRDISIKADASRYIEYDQTAIIATYRFDVNVHGLGDTTNAGSILGLDFPAS